MRFLSLGEDGLLHKQDFTEVEKEIEDKDGTTAMDVCMYLK